MKMNFLQRIVIGIGVFLILLSGVFLPYEGRPGDSRKKYMGYHFTTPKAITVHNAFFPKATNRTEYINGETIEVPITEEDAVRSGYSAHIILSPVIIQMVTM